MPRIAHVISTPEGVGGAERVLEALCAGGRDRDWEQFVINPFARDPETAEIRSQLSGARYAGRSCDRLWHVPAVRHWLRGQLAEIAPDLVHVHLFHAAALTASLKGPHPRILTHHHGDFLASAGRTTEARVDRWADDRYDKVVAVSEWTARYLRDSRGLPADRVRTITNGWSGEPLKHSVAADPPTIVSVGNLRPEKGQDALLRAFAIVAAERPDAVLRILGEGSERERLEALTSKAGIADRTTFLGRVDPPWEELSRADVFATASRVEPLGIAALEGMAAGLPVVAPRVGGLADLVDDGVSGVLFDPGDDEAMAAALIALLDDQQRARSMGEAGARAAAGQRADAMVDSYFALYEELI